MSEVETPSCTTQSSLVVNQSFSVIVYILVVDFSQIHNHDTQKWKETIVPYLACLQLHVLMHPLSDSHPMFRFSSW